MKQGSNQRRSRGRGNGARRSNRNQTYDSNGPDVKVRGTAQQVLDKYLQLARDAQSGGDRIKAEAYLQFAEHYFRILNADRDNQENSERRAEQTADAQAVPADEGRAEQKPARNRRRSAKNEASAAAEAASVNGTDSQGTDSQGTDSQNAADSREGTEAESEVAELAEPGEAVANA